MNDEERIRKYVRRRADVVVPDDLTWPNSAPGAERWWAPRSIGAWARVAAGGLVAVLVLVVLNGLPFATRPGFPSNMPGSGSSATPTRVADLTFPTEVGGLPVSTVAHAVDLLQAGKLDGQAIAVAGYYSAFSPSCPYPGRYIGPLEQWCDYTALADTPAEARLCSTEGNSTSCHEATGAHLSPFLVSETSGSLSGLFGGLAGDPAAVVLIGHAGDPRQWLCTDATQDQCSQAFVVDRIAWAEGHSISLSAPDTGDQQTGAPIHPTLTLDQVLAAVGLGDESVAAAPFRAADISTVDSRWNFAGNDIRWLVRSLDADHPSSPEGTRAEAVWLVDDATDEVVDGHPLAWDAGDQPGRIWPMATVHGYECCPGDLSAFVRLQSSAGMVLYEGALSGAMGGDGFTTFGGGYGSRPIVLPAGDYTIGSWLGSSIDGGVTKGECSTLIRLQPLDDVRIDADFPSDQACTFKPAPSPTPDS